MNIVDQSKTEANTGNFMSTYEVSNSELPASHRSSPKQSFELYRFIKDTRGMASSISINDMQGRKEKAAKLLNKRVEEIRSKDLRIVEGYNRKARSKIESKLLQYSNIKETMNLSKVKG